MIEGLPNFDMPLDICEDCVIGNQSRYRFPKGKAWRAKRQLELVDYSCGPIKTISNGRKR